MALTIIEENTMRSIQRACQSIVEKNGSVDWKQRRYEIARDIVAGMYSKTTEDQYSDISSIVKLAVTVADELIKELKLKGGFND